MEKEIKLGTQEYLEVAQKTLDKTIQLIAKSLNRGLANEKDDVAMSFSLISGPILETSHSLLVLS